MSLPTRTTADDVRSITAYLKTKPAGASRDEIKAALDPPAVDARKIAAYDAWELVEEDGERYKLTPRGRRLARASNEEEKDLFAEVLRDVRAYRMVLEWAFHQGLDVIENVEVAARWHDHNRDALGTDREETILRQVVCFFSIADAAGIGQYIQGRRGSPTRLELNREALGQFIGDLSLTPDEFESEQQAAAEDDPDETTAAYEQELKEVLSPPSEAADPQTANGQERSSEPPRSATGNLNPEPRVFISHGHNMEIVDQLKTMLDLADLQYEIAVEKEDTAIPVPEKVFSAMRRCTAAVICVTADEGLRREDGSYAVNENVLIEIGAAFVLYEKRVVLVWDRRINIPSNLQGLYRCEFEGSELTWAAGMKLMKAVSKFKRSDTAR